MNFTLCRLPEPFTSWFPAHRQKATRAHSDAMARRRLGAESVGCCRNASGIGSRRRSVHVSNLQRRSLSSLPAGQKPTSPGRSANPTNHGHTYDSPPSPNPTTHSDVTKATRSGPIDMTPTVRNKPKQRFPPPTGPPSTKDDPHRSTVTSVMCGRHRIRRGYPRTQVPLCVPTQLAPIDGRRQRKVDYNALGTRP